MSKYTVLGPKSGKWDDYYVMENGEECVYFDLQAQAEICAFALNAIAEGLTLATWHPTDNREVRVYNGPTEGVA